MLIFKHGVSPLLTTGKDHWETPDDLFASYHHVYPFVLDAAANHGNHKVSRWFGPGGEKPNALTVTWPLDVGHVWLNPPYSKGLQQKFVRKALLEVQVFTRLVGFSHHVICLLPARTDTKLFHDVILPHAKHVNFLKGRLKFKEKGKPSENSAPFPSMIVIF